MNHNEVGICDDKGEINLRIRIKIDWETRRYYLKKLEIDHQEI